MRELACARVGSFVFPAFPQHTKLLIAYKEFNLGPTYGIDRITEDWYTLTTARVLWA